MGKEGIIMETIEYIIAGYVIVASIILWVVVRRAKKRAAKVGHKWHDLWDAKKWEYYLKSIGAWPKKEKEE